MKKDTMTPAEALDRLREMEGENDRLEALIKMRDNRILELRRALGDAIATYNPNRKETIVTAERQEAWINALNQ